MSTSRLVNDWANTFGTDNCPDEETDTCCWDNVGLDREQMSNLVDGKPNRRKGAEPKYEE